ncbi:MAG: hypothetical protein WBD11_09095, partial [Xanthobacteraceae bacterium]
VQGVADYAIFMLDLNGYVTNWNAGAARPGSRPAGFHLTPRKSQAVAARLPRPCHGPVAISLKSLVKVR